MGRQGKNEAQLAVVYDLYLVRLQGMGIVQFQPGAQGVPALCVAGLLKPFEASHEKRSFDSVCGPNRIQEHTTSKE